MRPRKAELEGFIEGYRCEVRRPELTRVGMSRPRAMGFEAGRAQAVQDLAERSALMDELREMGLPLPGGER